MKDTFNNYFCKQIRKNILYEILKILFHVFTSLFIIISFVLIGICKWAKDAFNVGLSAIINTMTGPLEGTSSDTVWPAVKYCVPFLMIGIAISVFLIVLDYRFIKNAEKRKSNIYFGVTTCLAILIIVSSLVFIQSSYDVIGYFSEKNEDSSLLEERYVDPRDVKISANGKTRNLIYIYLESMETAYASKKVGGFSSDNYIPKLTDLANKNISFSNTDKLGGFYAVEGSGWTMGALFTTTAGISFEFPVGINDMENYSSFASGVYNLGDFLKDSGYNQEFLCGSNASHGGRKKYFQQHGNYKIYDLYSAREDNYIDDDYYVWWGYEDYILYDIAKDELLKLAQQKEPFNLTMLTVDTHNIGGYICDYCGDKYEENTANVVACADNQIAKFIAWCKKQDFYANTSIIITGDHPRMDNHLVEGIDYNDRKVYNCFINGANSNVPTELTMNRDFSAMDIFPTILSELGFSIEGERLGLGVNLYSGEKTLIEQYGIDNINRQLLRSTEYYVKNFAPELSNLYATDISGELIQTINFSKKNYNADRYVKKGISKAEQNYSWTEGNVLDTHIPIDGEKDKVKIVINYAGAIDRNQKYIIYQSNKKISTGMVNNNKGQIVFEAFVLKEKCDFVLEFPNAISPYEQGVSDDMRKLGIKIISMDVYK